MSVPKTGTFKFVSLVGEELNPAAGVTEKRPASQTVRLNEPVHIWNLRQQAGYFVFRFAIKDAYGFTTVQDNKVTATIHEDQDKKWNLIYREVEKAYTISPEDDLEKGWTVLPEFSVDPDIRVEPIISTRSDPPLFLPTQLFCFVEVQE